MKAVYPVIFTQLDDGYMAYSPDFEINTQGDNLTDAIKMMRDAIGLMGIDMQDDKKEIPAPSDEEKTVFTQRDLIQFEDFEKIQLVVAKVLKCEKVPKADKLLMSTLKVGDTERVVVSGIAKFYTPEEMVGKKVVLLANLAPRKIRGVESHGMLLCAANADDSKLSLLTVDSDMEDGCEIG